MDIKDPITDFFIGTNPIVIFIFIMFLSVITNSITNSSWLYLWIVLSLSWTCVVIIVVKTNAKRQKIIDEKKITELKGKIKKWKKEGYNVDELEKTFKLKNLSEKVQNLRHYEKTIQKLKHFEQELFSLPLDGYESEVQSIKEKLKNPNKMDAVESELSSLKLKIEKSRSAPSKKKRTYYDILGIKPDATSEQIKTIYKRLAKIYHPDKGKHLGVNGDKKFRVIKEAYETLIDPEKRKKYNENLGISNTENVF